MAEYLEEKMGKLTFLLKFLDYYLDYKNNFFWERSGVIYPKC
jgi:hypothetical protein